MFESLGFLGGRPLSDNTFNTRGTFFAFFTEDWEELVKVYLKRPEGLIPLRS